MPLNTHTQGNPSSLLPLEYLSYLLAIKMLPHEASQQIFQSHRFFKIQFEWVIALDEISDLFVVVSATNFSDVLSLSDLLAGGF
jgi:hypothetical protein